MHDIKKLTTAVILSMGLLAVNMEPVSAQEQTGTQDKNKAASTSSGQSMGSTAMDNIFINKASEANLAEIELAKMALEKGASEEVRDYAEIIIEHHTAAQTELYSIISKSPSKYPGITMTNPGNSGTTVDETDIASPDNDADKTATFGGTGGTTGSSMATGKTNGEYNSNLGGNNESTASDANTTQSTTVESTTREANTGNKAGIVGSGNDASNTNTTNVATAGSSAYLVSELSAEHKELMRKLTVLSGAAFDRMYMEAMVKEHEKAVELFEKQALHSKDNELQAFASKMLPILKEHYLLAQKLTKQ